MKSIDAFQQNQLKKFFPNSWTKKHKVIFQLGELVRTANIERFFSKGGSTNWSSKFYTIIQLLYDTILLYWKNYLLDRYNETLSKPRKLNFE